MLIDVPYSQKAFCSFEKSLNDQNYSSGFQHPAIKFPPAKFTVNWILKQSGHDFFHDYYWILNQSGHG